MLAPHHGLDPRYLAYALKASEQSLLHACAKDGTTVQSIEFEALKRFVIPLAPSAEQTRIADALDELFSDLDAAVAALQRVRGKLKLYRAAVLKAAVEGRLTAEWREQHPDAEPASRLLQRILDERRRRWEEDQLARCKAKGTSPPRNWKTKYREPQPPDLCNSTALPATWSWTCMGQAFSVHVGATPSRGVPTYWNGDIPWVASGEVQFAAIHATRERITRHGLENSSTRINPAGTVMLSMIGEGKTRGQAGVLKIAAANNQNCAAIWVSQTPVSPTFVYLWLLYRYEQTRALGSGNNQPAMNKTIVEAIPLPLPPEAEQQAIVEAVEDQLSVIDHLESDIDAKLASAQALRQAILRDALAGKLVPQDPADEPASALLERIAAERRAAPPKRPAPRKAAAGEPHRGAKRPPIRTPKRAALRARR